MEEPLWSFNLEEFWPVRGYKNVSMPFVTDEFNKDLKYVAAKMQVLGRVGKIYTVHMTMLRGPICPGKNGGDKWHEWNIFQDLFSDCLMEIFTRGNYCEGVHGLDEGKVKLIIHVRSKLHNKLSTAVDIGKRAAEFDDCVRRTQFHITVDKIEKAVRPR